MIYFNFQNNLISSGFTYRLLRNKHQELDAQKRSYEAMLVLSTIKHSNSLESYKKSSRDLRYLVGYSGWNPFVSNQKKYNIIVKRLELSVVELVEKQPLSESARLKVSEYKKALSTSQEVKTKHTPHSLFIHYIRNINNFGLDEKIINQFLLYQADTSQKMSVERFNLSKLFDFQQIIRHQNFNYLSSSIKSRVLLHHTMSYFRDNVSNKSGGDDFAELSSKFSLSYQDFFTQDFILLLGLHCVRFCEFLDRVPLLKQLQSDLIFYPSFIDANGDELPIVAKQYIQGIIYGFYNFQVPQQFYQDVNVFLYPDIQSEEYIS